MQGWIFHGGFQGMEGIGQKQRVPEENWVFSPRPGETQLFSPNTSCFNHFTIFIPAHCWNSAWQPVRYVCCLYFWALLHGAPLLLKFREKQTRNMLWKTSTGKIISQLTGGKNTTIILTVLLQWLMNGPRAKNIVITSFFSVKYAKKVIYWLSSH